MRISLDSGARVAFLKADGTFSFELPQGVYQLDVFSANFEFEPLKIEVGRNDIRVSKVDLLGGRPSVRVPYSMSEGLALTPLGQTRLFEEHQSISVFDLLKNPMVLMLLPVVLMAVMPKLTANMSPEDMEELQKQSATMTKAPNLDISSSIASFLASDGRKSKKEKR